MRVSAFLRSTALVRSMLAFELQTQPLRGDLVRRIEIVLARDPDQCEERISPGIGSAAPMRFGLAISSSGQTGQSEEIHSPDECASRVVRFDKRAGLVIAVVCTVAISCRPSVLRTISNPLDSGAYRRIGLTSARPDASMAASR